MTLAAILLATALFFVALQRSNLIALSWSIVAETNGALSTLRNGALDDDARERAAQSFAVHMFGLFGRMAVLSVLVCAAPLALLTLCVFAGLTDSAEIWRIGTSWPFIAANIALFAAMLKWGPLLSGFARRLSLSPWGEAGAALMVIVFKYRNSATGEGASRLFCTRHEAPSPSPSPQGEGGLRELRVSCPNLQGAGGSAVNTGACALLCKIEPDSREWGHKA